jgi:trimethylamine--corrinoid protein Co-methyltransferase
MPLDRQQVYFGPGSDCLYVLDHSSGERRLGTLEDVEQIIRVCDALPNIDFLMSACVPSDVPPPRANHRQMLAMIENSIKPIMFVTNDFECSLDVVKAAEIVAGGATAHRQKPYTCCYINVTDPLRHNDESLRKLLFLADKGVPTTYTPMVLRGVNGPVTSAGAIALANAGELVGLVLAQLKKEGAPIIHGGGYGDVFDMRTAIGIYAGPESYGGRPAMASFYRLPIFGLGGASDAKLVDGQAVAEAAFSLMSEALGGSNLVHDVGYLESGKCYSLEQLVICNELIGYVRRFTQGFEVSDETLALDLIAEQGPHGEYLSTEHTVEHYKQDWYPALFDRKNYDGWVAEGSKTLHDRAAARVGEILADHRPEPLDSTLREQISSVLG